MKKLIIAVVMSLMGTLCFGKTTVVTNAVDVYDLKVELRTPVVKTAKATRSTPSYIYRAVETRKLKGRLTLAWVQTSGDDFETVVPSLTLADLTTKQVADYNIVVSKDGKLGTVPFDLTILGKNMDCVAATFVGVNKKVSASKSGYKFLEFVGFGHTRSFAKSRCNSCNTCNTCNDGCSPCQGPCSRIYDLSGRVTGMYSCGCAGKTPSAAAQSCGYDADAVTAIVGCDGTWVARYNTSLSR